MRARTSNSALSPCCERRADVVDPDPAARHRGGPPRVTGGHRVALDAVVPPLVAAGGHGEARVRVALDLDPEGAHHDQRQVDEGLGLQVAGHPHGGRRARVGRSDEETREELRRAVARDLGGAPRQSVGLDDDRGVVAAARRLHPHPERAQRGHQVADRTLAHAGVAVEQELAASERDRGGQEAERRSGQREVESPAGARPEPVHPDDVELRWVVGVRAHVGAERAQRALHDGRVLGDQGAVDPRTAGGERRDQQRPVGDRLRARHGGGGLERSPGRDHEAVGVGGHDAPQGTTAVPRSRGRTAAGTPHCSAPAHAARRGVLRFVVRADRSAPTVPGHRAAWRTS
jgi:hypothetical protein